MTKFCPIKERHPICFKEYCALYDEEKGQCAFLSQAQKGESEDGKESRSERVPL